MTLDVDSIRALIANDRRTLVEPELKKWCGRRWRELFVSNAAGQQAAVSAASSRISLPGTDLSVLSGRDQRPDRQRIAERFLRDGGEDWVGVPDIPYAAPGDFTLVFCPGLINSMLPVRGLASVLPQLEQLGYRVLAADAHPMRSCDANVADLEAAIERGEGYSSRYTRIAPEDAEPPGDVVLVGYSKGAADALALLIRRPDLAPRVKALVCWAGAVGGSYLADDIYDTIADVRIPLGGLSEPLKAALKAVFPLVRLDGISDRVDEYDVKGAIRDLTTTERAGFLAENAEAIDALDVPIFNLTAATTATEVPLFQVQGYLQIRNRKPGGDPDNDMQLTQNQARMATPMATDLAVLSAHHWDITYDAFPLHMRMGSANLNHKFPRAAALTAVCQLVDELGLVMS